MNNKQKSSVRYRIKSYHYDDEANRRLLFTLEEPGVDGEARQYAQEIMASKTWLKDFTITDAATIIYAAESEVEVV